MSFTEGSDHFSAADLVAIISKCAECGVDSIKLGEIEVSFRPSFMSYQTPKDTSQNQLKDSASFQMTMDGAVVPEQQHQPSNLDLTMDDLVITDPEEWEKRAMEGSN